MYQNSAVFKRRESVLVYGLATISRLLKIAGLFCRIQSLLQGSFAEETYNFKEPTNRSHPIVSVGRVYWCSKCGASVLV